MDKLLLQKDVIRKGVILNARGRLNYSRLSKIVEVIEILMDNDLPINANCSIDIQSPLYKDINEFCNVKTIQQQSENRRIHKLDLVFERKNMLRLFSLVIKYNITMGFEYQKNVLYGVINDIDGTSIFISEAEYVKNKRKIDGVLSKSLMTC